MNYVPRKSITLAVIMPLLFIVAYGQYGANIKKYHKAGSVLLSGTNAGKNMMRMGDSITDFRLNTAKNNASDISHIYVVTGDINTMWLYDDSSQRWPYISFNKQEAHLQRLIAAVIDRQTTRILNAPYANVFHDHPTKTGEWANNATDMKPLYTSKNGKLILYTILSV